MKHFSLKRILDRELDIAESQYLISKWSPYLEELCNFGSSLLIRCEKSLREVSGTPASLIYLYYHIIQMTDGIHVLCSNSCFEASLPLLRSQWEGSLSLLYILENDFDLRSTAWLALGHLEQKEYWESQDLSSARGQEIELMKKKDKYLRNCEFGEKDQNKLKTIIKSYDLLLSKPKFRNIIEKMSITGRKRKTWYSINDGPTNLRKLAEYLGRSLEYEYLYGQFSAVAHAKDAHRAISVENGNPYMVPIRSSTNGDMIYSLACSYFVDSTMMIAKKLCNEEKVEIQILDIVKRHRPEVLKSISNLH